MATATATATVTAGACCGFLLLLLHLHLAAADDKLLVYRLVLHTFWSRDRFPKHFPDWRPPAQWSALVGRSHDQESGLFHVGSPATPALRQFAETGRYDMWDNSFGQGTPGVLDHFVAPPIYTGVGRSEAHFFVDSNHSKVSVVSRITPSPDWFIGIDSFDLCLNGNWIDSITIEADPLDAGTDNGFTFTAPNWRTEPPGPVYRITSRHPAHPAGSFYYPQLPRLPPLATFQIIKLKEYNLGEEFAHAEDDRRYDVLQSVQQIVRPAPIPVTSNDIDNEIDLGRTDETHTTPKTDPDDVELPQVIALGDKVAFQQHVHKWNREHKRLLKKKKYRDCRVGEWAAWGPCSQSCGVGEMQRHRPVLRETGRRGGRPCPALTETRWCGSAHSCDHW